MKNSLLQDDAQNAAEQKCWKSNEADEAKVKQESMQVNIVDVGKGWWPSAQSLKAQPASESISARESWINHDQLLLEANEEDSQHNTNSQNCSKQGGEAAQLSHHPSEERPQDKAQLRPHPTEQHPEGIAEGLHVEEKIWVPLDPLILSRRRLSCACLFPECIL